MSRSYRKNPVLKYAPSAGKWGKQFANKRVRRFKGKLSSGKAYKKLYETWNIHDVVERTTLNGWLERWGKWWDWLEMKGYEGNLYGDTLQDAVGNWKKTYYWK